uniref:ARAD1A10670p n=1 Tax=Blastobotrys adeninivorans TaxID=409370 RepID=A0A060SX51_BLAAD
MPSISLRRKKHSGSSTSLNHQQRLSEDRDHLTVDEPEQQSGSRSIWSSRSRIRRKSSSGDSIGQNAGGSSSVVSLLASLSRVREFVDHDSPNDSGTDNGGEHSNKNSSSFESDGRARPKSAPTSPPARAVTHKHDQTRHHKHDLSASDTPDLPGQPDQPDPESSIPSLSLSTPPVITFDLPSPSPRLSEGSTDDNNQGHRRTPTPTNNNNNVPSTGSESTAPIATESTFDFRTPLSRLRKKTAQVFFSGDESSSHNFVRRISTRNADSQASKESNEIEPEKVPSTSSSPFGTPKLSPVDPGTKLQSPKRPPFFRSRSTQEELKSSSNNSSRSNSEADSGTVETTGRPRSRTLGSLTGDSGSTVGPQTSNTIGSNDSRRPITPSGASTGSTTPSSNTLFRPSLSSLLGSRLRSTTDVHAFGNESQSRSSTTIVAAKDPLDSLVLPERIPDETVEEYLHRVKETVAVGGAVAAVLSKSGNQFHKDALKAYMDSFYFKDDPIDMALRKFLMYAKLPKETQQIDRVLEGFAASYHKANPNIFLDPESAHIVVFSLMILHTDFFNKNNKNKMQKFEFTRNTNAKCVSNDILECFYDNITYTPFIHTDEDFTPMTRSSWGKRTATFGRNSKDLLDPYTYLLDGRLDELRPGLSNVLSLEDPYSFKRIESVDEYKNLRQQFIDGPYLQLVSQRSRPEAFLTPDGTADPEHSDPGVVDIKVVKIGILYRREARRMLYSKSAWREWGIILTSSQLYLFKDASWIKNLIREEAYSSKKAPSERGPSIIRAPIDGLHPTSVLPTSEMMALLSSSSDAPQRKNSFLLSGRGGSQDWFAAESEEEMKDWMAKLSFASCFNTYRTSILSDGAAERTTHRPRRMHSLRRRGSFTSIRKAEAMNAVQEEGDDDQPKKGACSGQDSAQETKEPTPELPVLGQDLQISDDSKSEARKSIVSGYSEDQHALEVPASPLELLERYSTQLQLVEVRIREIEEKIREKHNQIRETVRSGDHLKILVPIQQRTREAVILAAGRLSAVLDWQWVDNHRLACYKELFELEHQIVAEILSEAREKCRLEKPSFLKAEDNRSINSRQTSESLVNSRTSIYSREGEPEPLSIRTMSSTDSVKTEGRLDVSYPLSPREPREVELGVPRESMGASDEPEPAENDWKRTGSLRVRPRRSFQTSLRDNSKGISVTKNRNKPKSDQEDVQRSASLLRKEEGKFELHGKTFSVVEVNPDLASHLNHDPDNEMKHKTDAQDTKESGDEVKNETKEETTSPTAESIPETECDQ